MLPENPERNRQTSDKPEVSRDWSWLNRKKNAEIRKALVEYGIASTDIFVYETLETFIDKNGYCYPSHERIAERSGLSVRTVMRSVERLEETPFLEVRRSYRPAEKINGQWKGNKGQKREANKYVLWWYPATINSDTESLMENTNSDTESLKLVTQCHPISVTESHERLPLTITSNVSLSEDGKGFTTYWKKKAKKRGKLEYPDEFETFWDTYPNPKDKKQTFLNWLTTLESNYYDAEELLTAAKNYRREQAGKEKKHMKHSTTFLGPGEPWRDRVETTLEDDIPDVEILDLPGREYARQR